MRRADDRPSLEPTIVEALWRYRWLMLLVLVGSAALGALYAILQPAAYKATAAFVVQDPQAVSVLNPSSDQRPERYVADQVAILESTVVAERAAQQAAEAGATLSTESLLEDTEVISDSGSDHIEIRFKADTPESSLVGANSIASAYLAIRQESAAQNYASALRQLDQSIEGVADELATIGDEIASLLAPVQAREELDQQFAEALDRLVALQDALATGSVSYDPSVPDPTRVALDDLLTQFETLQVVTSLEQENPEVAALLEQQREAIGRQSALIQRRDELRVEAELGSTGLVVYAPAVEAKQAGSPLPLALGVAVLLGALLGTAVSYWLSLRHRSFSDRFEPEPILDAPFLGEIPDFRDEGIKSDLPVQARPASASAEAFRFVAAALDVKLGERGVESARGAATLPASRQSVRALVLVSAKLGEGKTVVAVNTALASARQGNRVLVIDADFGEQRLATILAGSKAAPGLSDMVEQGRRLAEVVQTVTLSAGITFDLLSRGLEVVTAPEFFRSSEVQAFFAAVRDEYDLVLIDAPPLLQVAYASTVVRLADQALVVTPHRGDARATKEVAERLALLGIEAVGYVYNRAPLRADLIGSEGSLKDVLGPGPIDEGS